jgi:AcrR family transcriptional regulator
MNIKERILETSRIEFIKKGMKDVKTDELAKEIGISKRTLYEYYPSKKDLFKAVAEIEMKNHKCEMKELIDSIGANNSDFITDIKNIWSLICNKSNEYSNEFYLDVQRVMPQSWKYNGIQEEMMKADFMRITDIGINQGCIKSHINKEILFLIYFHSIKNLMIPEVLMNLPFTSKEVLAMIFEVVFTGVLTDEARLKYLALN